MKRSTVYLASMIMAITIFVSCSKTGSTGPQGATGATGPAGAVGPAGNNGSQIYSGATSPAATAGNTGDYYLDVTTDILYGPKTASGWGSGISLMGSTGAAGQAGSQIYSGNAAPSASQGTNGDYYLDATNYVLYGPKTASGWGTGIILKGATGTANVIYSAWGFANNVRDTIIDGSNLVVANFPAASLSQADLSSASIEVFFNFNGQEEVLPYTSYAGGAVSTVSFIPQQGNLLITRFTADNSGSTTLPLTLQYRFVIIPGGVQGNSIVNPYAKGSFDPAHF